MWMTKRQLQVRIREEDGALWATVDEFPGVLATGDDLEELRVTLEQGICLVEAEPDGEVPDLRLSVLKRGSGEAPASAELVAA
jgi:predicted RNase H-like HicB family nuclease